MEKGNVLSVEERVRLEIECGQARRTKKIFRQGVKCRAAAFYAQKFHITNPGKPVPKMKVRVAVEAEVHVVGGKAAL